MSQNNEEELMSESNNESSDSKEASYEEIMLTLSDAYQEPPEPKLCKRRTGNAYSELKLTIWIDDLMWTKEAQIRYRDIALDLVGQLQK